MTIYFLFLWIVFHKNDIQVILLFTLCDMLTGKIKNRSHFMKAYIVIDYVIVVVLSLNNKFTITTKYDYKHDDNIKEVNRAI